MISPFRAAAIQTSSSEDKAANLLATTALVERAAAAGAQLVALPEMFNCYGRASQILAAAESVPGPTSEALCSLARRLAITLVAGSFCERTADPAKGFNTSLLIGPDGNVLAQYRKRHLFDLEIPGQVSCRESSWLTAGDDLCVTGTPCGRIGQAVCYDLRFPEMFREMVDLDCQIICIPSAFTLTTGRDHWETLLRARAIENQAYLIAPNQFGQHAPGLTSYGRSMIVDPWGTVLCTAADDCGMILADIDLSRVAEVRARLPALQHRRDRRIARS
ncbi:MAG TPA: carbon-nitrogen hydrolase family protein [Pirellulales bacterium]|jgi:predicted amidohydrolase